MILLQEGIDGLSLLRRWLGKIERQGECWVWTGAVNSKGYPAIKIAGRVLYAHRLSHEMFNGPIADGNQVHHKCLNPRCVNPAHLTSITADLNRTLQTLGVGELPEDLPI